MNTTNWPSLRPSIVGGLSLLAMGHAVAGEDASRPETALLAPADAAPGDQFGEGVAFDGDRLVVGAPLHYFPPPEGLGSVYVWEPGPNGEWTVRARLYGSDSTPVDEFGNAVAVQGDTLIVGAHLANTPGDFSGAAYVFMRDSAGDWTESQKLLPPLIGTGDFFGEALLLRGDRAFIGAPGHPQGGCVVVYARSGDAWVQHQVIDSPGTGGQFGGSLALDGDTLLVGAPRFGEGAVHVLRRDAYDVWSMAAVLLEPIPNELSGFGRSVAVRGDLAVVGSVGYTADRAYAFARNAAGDWSFRAELVPSGQAENFGTAVAIGTDVILVGASHSGPSGSVYWFTGDGQQWTQTARLEPSTGGYNENFGRVLAFDGHRLLVGAQAASRVGQFSGAAYVYDPAPGDVDGDGDVDLTDLAALLSTFGVCQGESGFRASADFNADGCIDLADLTVVLSGFGT